MSDKNIKRESARQALFSGKLDIEGMDDVLSLYRDLFELTEKNAPPGNDQRELTDDEALVRRTMLADNVVKQRQEEGAQAELLARAGGGAGAGAPSTQGDQALAGAANLGLEG